MAKHSQTPSQTIIHTHSQISQVPPFCDKHTAPNATIFRTGKVSSPPFKTPPSVSHNSFLSEDRTYTHQHVLQTRLSKRGASIKNMSKMVSKKQIHDCFSLFLYINTHTRTEQQRVAHGVHYFVILERSPLQIHLSPHRTTTLTTQAHTRGFPPLSSIPLPSFSLLSVAPFPPSSFPRLKHCENFLHAICTARSAASQPSQAPTHTAASPSLPSLSLSMLLEDPPLSLFYAALKRGLNDLSRSISLE